MQASHVLHSTDHILYSKAELILAQILEDRSSRRGRRDRRKVVGSDFFFLSRVLRGGQTVQLVVDLARHDLQRGSLQLQQALHQVSVDGIPLRTTPQFIPETTPLKHQTIRHQNIQKKFRLLL